MNDERCETCRFWSDCPGVTEESEADKAGYCKRFPPQWANDGLRSVAGPSDFPVLCNLNWCHPVTDATDWCGEWRPLPVVADPPA
jgi:hypothetical protein